MKVSNLSKKRRFNAKFVFNLTSLCFVAYLANFTTNAFSFHSFTKKRSSSSFGKRLLHLNSKKCFQTYKVGEFSPRFGSSADDESNCFVTGIKSNYVSSSKIMKSNTTSWLKQNKYIEVAATIAVTSLFFPVQSFALSFEDLGQMSLSTSATSLVESLSGTGFYQAFSLVFLSELGDKTFFIAGLLSMKTSRFVSFVGSVGALAVMTFISCVIGQVFHAVPSSITSGLPLDDIAAIAAFTFFGFKTLKDAIEIDPADGNSGIDEEFADAEEAVEGSDAIKQRKIWAQIGSTFGLVFAAEFGDRSFLSTIALSAAQNPFSVGIGAVAAHAVATGIAVLGGAVVSKYLSEKVIGYIGGSLFLVFAITTALGVF